ncbi:MAG TPA: response regulator [Polyangiaceae bacterium]|nr:response regulator [Polyangiaceae bacterium]
MPKTLLAVDDSATMRRVLEITFVGEDFTVHASADRGGLLAKLGENPSAVVIDTTLEGDDGYAICKEVRSKLPRAAIVLMASRYTPYDQGRGRDSGADDYVDKPFDTQQLIDKVKKAIGVRESSAGPAVAAAPPPPPQPHVAPAPPQPVAAPQFSSPQAGAMPRLSDAQTTAPRPAYTPGQPPQRSGTLMFAVDGPAAPPAVGAAPAPSPPAPHVQARPAAPVAPPRVATPAAMPAVAAPSAAIAAQANGLAPKLAQMGLTPAQIEGVLALSREVIEQVVWEIVPQLAETLIQEEIARLTKE